ncbi:uncharacterized protein CMU_031380 [Cryptosporidium muris RN66]|uniref:Uncharacterized protein n=1 Tax=Cryptosporidium muris (strain RN66) TaxID=441375 RepID=B6AIF6_CRYMR|nr:uncharacterized protein CMU_031380 [Cryptosporidium muris RN66]EEA07997.1 hypothetical protein, conserved [Cryptosporidium muris RN66]|eukprot:XP_002142346.1 hypothetical protein [Cryptosporidium muris RN66]
MTEVQKVLKLLDDAKDICETLLQTSKEDIELKLEDFQRLESIMGILITKVAKYRIFLKETDPEKQIYGPKMREKLKNLCEKYEILDTIYEEELKFVFQHVKDRYELELKRKIEFAKLQEEMELERKIQEGRLETLQEEQQRQKILKEKNEAIAKKEHELKLKLDRDRNEKETLMNKIIEAYRLQENTYNFNKNSIDKFMAIFDGFEQMASNTSLGDFKFCINNIKTLFLTISGDPSALKYRFIRLQNNSFLDSFGSRPGAISILWGSGFRLISDKESYEYWGKLKSEISSLGDLPEYSLCLYMDEPDPIQNYNAWISWIDWLSSLVRIISDISKLITNISSKENLIELLREKRICLCK